MKRLLLVILFAAPTIGFAANGAFFIRSFDVYFHGENVNITWETGNAALGGSFYIERSNDAVHFEELKKADGESADSKVAYLEVDEAPLKGTSYYRIKQITKEGFTIYSPIRTIKSYETLAAEMNLTPNPCDESFRSELKSYSEEEILVVLRDKAGVEYYSKIKLTNDQCTIEAIETGTGLPKGEYTITASSKNELYTQVINIK